MPEVHPERRLLNEAEKVAADLKDALDRADAAGAANDAALRRWEETLTQADFDAYTASTVTLAAVAEDVKAAMARAQEYVTGEEADRG